MDRYKPLFSLLLIFIAAPVLAALVTPWIYQVVQSRAPEVLQWVVQCEATETHLFWADLADSVFTSSFRRVHARLVLVFSLLFLYPALKMSGFRGRETLGIPVQRNGLQLLGFGLGISIVSMLLVYLLGLGLGVFAWDLDGASGAELFAGVLKLLLGGLLIGVLEEVFFRGFVLNAMRRGLGLWGGVMLSSAFFALVHFVRPDSPRGIIHWYSGVVMLMHPFAGAEGVVLQPVCTLFSMGVVLAVLSVWTRSVYLAMGLHAGWVWVMMFFRLVAENQETMVWLYGTSDWLPNSWMGPILAAVVLVGFIFSRKTWVRLGEEG